MKWIQKEITLNSKKRGFHLITDEILSYLPELKDFRIGTAHIFIKHTSASLSLNENYDPDVRKDMESFFNKLVPQDAPYFVHTAEGPDDMPAHLKASLLGNSLVLPVTNGKLNIGIWQGIYLCEHRNRSGSRKIVVTISGE